MTSVKKVQITLVRHGYSKGQELGVCGGHKDWPLTAFGREQARLAGKTLKDVEFDAIISSDSSRAHDTAEEILKANRKCDDGLLILDDQRLREKTYGILDGQNRGAIFDLAEAKGIIGLRNAKSTKEVENIFVPEGWETHEELTKRVSGFLKEFLGQCPESSHTLLASHGGTIRCFLDLLQATGKVDGLQPFQDLPTDKKRPKNTAITSINLTVDKKTLDIQQGEVTRFYDDLHLEKFNNNSCKSI